jgi:hypothetical protein
MTSGSRTCPLNLSPMDAFFYDNTWNNLPGTRRCFLTFLFKLDGWNMFKEEGQNDFVNVSYYMGTIIYSVINALIFCSDPCFPILKTQFIFFIFFMFSNFFFSFLQARKLYALNKWIHSPWRNMEQSSKNVQTCSNLFKEEGHNVL